MQARRINAPILVLLTLLAVAFGPAANGASSKPDRDTGTNAIPAVTQVEIPQSLFVIPATPHEGRNPFFPQSVVAAPVVIKKSNSTVDLASFVLNGITSPPKRTAMINGRTFEPGEEGEVKLPGGGKVLIKCEEIRGDSAIINVNGQRRELRLRFGL